MPFTPFHMGPGVMVKAVLRRRFSLMVFGWSQIIIDLQPLVVLLTGKRKLHGFTHTLTGALLIGGMIYWGTGWLLKRRRVDGG